MKAHNNLLSDIFHWRRNVEWRWLSSYKMNKIRTWLYASLHPCAISRIIFIFGCQRSGTTLLSKLVGLDHRINAIGEGIGPFFMPTSDRRFFRLVSIDDLEYLVLRQRSPNILLKPLNDSQRAANLLKHFPNSKGFWIFRNYEEVIYSHMSYYKEKYDPVEYIGDLLALNENSWKAENIPVDMQKFIIKLRGRRLNAPSCYALFWLARNSLLFEQLPCPELLVINYHEIVRSPHAALKAIGKHLAMDFDPRFAKLPKKIERTVNLRPEILPELLEACDTMFNSLKKRTQNIEV